MAGALIIALLTLYMVALFMVAWRADMQRQGARTPARRAAVYSFSLAALCTSWTYFGAVGSGTRDGWGYLPNFLGPILGMALFFPVYQRIAVVSKRENVGSIADFLSSRYGKSRPLGTLIACVSLAGALPYIALQLTSLSRAWAAIANRPEAPTFAPPVIVAALAGFAIFFGTRRPTLTTHNRGLVSVIALESLVKLTALGTVALLGVALLLRGNGAPGSLELGPLASPPADPLSFWTATMLCMVTAITLPRQFHLSFVELENTADLKTARWLFPIYMGVWAFAVFVIVVACRALLPATIDPDMRILALPMTYSGSLLTAIVFLGGFSAGAAMVMVETVALSAMISNELVLPWLATTRWRARPDFDIGRAIVFIRRGAIVGILLLAWLYYMLLSGGAGLAELGLTSLAASAQLLPSLVGAVLWRRGHARGALLGIVGGIGVWAYMVVAPQLQMHGSLARFAPEFVTGVAGGALLNQGVLISLTLNVALYVGVSLITKPRLIDRVQSAAFVHRPAHSPSAGARQLGGTIGDLRALTAQFLGAEDATKGFDDFARRSGLKLRDGDPVDPATARSAERMLAGAIGASTARNVIEWALSPTGGGGSDAGQFLDEAAQAVQFSREVLQTTLNSLGQGVCVTDAEERMVAWNARYLELSGVSANDVAVGTPLADVIRMAGLVYGELPDETERLIERRLRAIRSREPQEFEWEWPGGITLKIAGAPTMSGEYVTSLTDVTELKAAAQALRTTNEELEERVAERTRELSKANRDLAEAKGRADRATSAQARFVAAASHDLMQPLHAARLFNAAVAEGLPPECDAARDYVEKADISIDSADRLLRALLNLSRLEIDGVRPAFSAVEVNALFEALDRDFQPLAKAKGLTLRVVPTEYWVKSDPDLLRSILQNLLGNALRYTASGSVLVCCRRDEQGVRIEVRDSGDGIDEAQLPLIFKEFARLPSAAAAAPGAGLGLSIAERICNAMGHDLRVRSRVGQGSNFFVKIERAEPQRRQPSALAGGKLARRLRVLCVEDEELILQGLTSLIQRWGAECVGVRTASEAEALPGHWDVLLVDFHLEDDVDGFGVLARMRSRAALSALVTANDEEWLRRKAGDLGVEVIRKPVAPASLRAFLMSAARTADESVH